MKTLLLSLAALLPFACFAAPALSDPRPPIPELLTTQKTRYTQVEVTNLSSDRVSFMHADGVTTVALSEFDDTNLDRLIPGYIARKRKAEADAIARRQREEQETKALEELRLAEAKRQEEINKAEALRQAELRKNPSPPESTPRRTATNANTYYVPPERNEPTRKTQQYCKYPGCTQMPSGFWNAGTGYCNRHAQQLRDEQKLLDKMRTQGF